METFVLDPRCWRIGRIFGRNPLIRRADRLEALMMLAALVVSLATVPVAGVLAATVYGGREIQYTRQAHERHVVAATVTSATNDGSATSAVHAKWPVATGDRTGSVRLATAIKPGERIEIWVDKDGNPVDPPTPRWHALAGAVATALATLLIVGFGLAFLVAEVCSLLDGARDAQWERELRCMQEDGGRTNLR